jgi:hypothetical protein
VSKAEEFIEIEKSKWESRAPRVGGRCLREVMWYEVFIHFLQGVAESLC